MKSFSFLASLATLSAVCLAIGCSPKSDGDKGSGGTGGGAGSGTAGSGTAGEAGASGGSAGSGTSGSSGSAGSGTAGSAGVGPGPIGWTQVQLIDDTTDPMETLHCMGSDTVSGILFNSLDQGWIVTRQGGPGSDISGGAVFKAKATSVDAVLFSGTADPLCYVVAGGGIEFNGIQKLGNDYLALSAACSVIISRDGGNTFGIELNSAQDELGINNIYAFRQLPGGGTFMFQNRIVSTSNKAPGTMSIGNWTEV